MDLGLVKAFEAELERHAPGFRVAFKDESALMQLVGALVRPFNRRFMTSFTTTIGKTVYFPSRAHYQESPARTFTTLAHEFVHLTDDEKHGVWFKVSYLLPQLLALPALVASVIALVFTSWAWAAVVGSFLLALPWPSPWRAKWEARGYTMTLAVIQWMTGVMRPEQRESIAENFYGPDYYYMVSDKTKARQLVDECTAYAASARISTDGPYAIVRSFMEKHGIARPL